MILYLKHKVATLSPLLKLAGACLAIPTFALALNPGKSLTQYTTTVWTQEHGLPQDSIRAITQTSDGYLWLGTDEGLARFDGYEFIIFNKDRGELPSNSITALAAGRDGVLWIGTSNGLASYRNKTFHTYSTKDGLPDNGIAGLIEDHAGALWIVAGNYLSRFESGKFTNFAPGPDVPVTGVRAVYEDPAHTIWVSGFGGVAKLDGGKFVLVIGPDTVGGDFIVSLLKDRNENLWIAGNKGLLVMSPTGKITRYGARDGLPDPFVRSLWEDRDGNIWAGTNGGLARLEHGRFVSPVADAEHDLDWVRCIYEDREGNLWVGMNSGLNRLRDDLFTTYSKTEGLPSDEPTAVYQDRKGRVWIGFHDAGLALAVGSGFRSYTTRNGLISNEVFSIREDGRGDLLVSTREGLSRMHDGHFTAYTPPDPLARNLVFDALEDRRGRLWIAVPSGLSELRGKQLRNVIPGGTLFNAAVVVLAEGRDGAIWAGSYGRGLWRLRDDGTKLFTTADGLSSDQIRSILQDADGSLWIGTFGGGLNRLRDGHFSSYTSKDGLLSDNVSDVEDDGKGSLWLSTTRGICHIAKKQLDDFAAGRIRSLSPVNYGVEDGLRSAQCAPGYPTGGGGTRTSDGRLWFPTSRGLAVYDPAIRRRAVKPPLVQFVEMTAEGQSVDFSHPARLQPGDGRLQVRYAGIHLSAPERVLYSYKLQGLDPDWVQAGGRRVINYNSLPQGHYRFIVRAGLAGEPASEASYAFDLLPHYYETVWFRCLAGLLLMAAAWGAYQMRLQQIRGRFALVLGERARLAREIHDTLAQGFVGISSQLDAVVMCLLDDPGAARQYLELARKMARHSLTEARRSVMDLRTSALEGQDLAAALHSGMRVWTAGSGVDVEVDITGQQNALPQEMEQHLLRIAQEAVNNALKHAGASKIAIRLHMEARKLDLRIIDNGRGFEERDMFSSGGGHFGLMGMRERAERVGGELRLETQPGSGTKVEVTAPLP
jgi:signal transduction histidine kinase/ligand-binding sensor domain-containing protein